jgi:hypothetical protein
MECATSRHVAIWIDHHEAILLAFEVGPSDSSVPHRPGDGWSQHRVDAQEYPLVQQYYDAVLSHLESQDEIWILGPGQMKHELCQQIEQHGTLKGRVVGLHHASRLADVELVFLRGERWHLEKADGAQADPLSQRPAQKLPEGSGTLR